MRADAEHALATLARGSQLRPSALSGLAMSHWLAGEVDQADDLFADAAEEGLELGVAASATAALGERALIASARGAWVAAEELTDQALRVIRRSGGSEGYPSSALTYAVAARVALHRGDSAACPGAAHASSAPATAPHARDGVLRRPDPLGARAGLPGAGGRRRRRHDAPRDRGDPAPTTGPRSASGPGGGAARQPQDHAGPGARASTLTEAELRLLPHLATHLSFREIGERLFLSRHTVKSHAMAIYRKLNVTSRNAAVERARELGLI